MLQALISRVLVWTCHCDHQPKLSGIVKILLCLPVQNLIQKKLYLSPLHFPPTVALTESFFYIVMCMNCMSAST